MTHWMFIMTEPQNQCCVVRPQVQTRTLTSESELSSSASVGALSNFFLCESGCDSLEGFGEGGESSANASVLTAIFFLGVPRVSE